MDLYGRLALPTLLEALAGVAGIQWLRLLYCYPTMVREPLIDVLRSISQVIPYIDMPLQHGEDAMLKAMKRGGSVEQYKRLFGRMREGASGSGSAYHFSGRLPRRDRCPIPISAELCRRDAL